MLRLTIVIEKHEEEGAPEPTFVIWRKPGSQVWFTQADLVDEHNAPMQQFRRFDHLTGCATKMLESQAHVMFAEGVLLSLDPLTAPEVVIPTKAGSQDGGHRDPTEPLG